MTASVRHSWEDLVKPYTIAFSEVEDSKRVGNVIVEPLERGFGITLGNALRRVLLSSIQGTAVIGMKIAGTLLEFASIPGVVEDVTDIVLNLKSLNLRLHGDVLPQKFTLSAKKPGVVTAEAIDTRGILDVLNPYQPICTLGEGSTLSMELKISCGKGYVPSESFDRSQRELGEIVIDAVFNPVKRVSFVVENTRVAQSTDYDRLILTVETDGSITPRDAVMSAAVILRDQLTHFISFENQEVTHTALKNTMREKREEIPAVFFRNIRDLELNVRSLNCLKSEDVVYIGDLVRKTREELLKAPNFGAKSLADIEEALGKFGLSLGMDIPKWSFDGSRETPTTL